MGLDMYAYKTKVAPISKIKRPPRWTDVMGNEVEEPNYEIEELHYWCKHPNLHGWMQDLWEANGGMIQDWNDFNSGDTIELDLDDLTELERAIKENELPHTEGFFFGESYDPNDLEFNKERTRSDLDFIKEARQAIEQGYHVYYTSWW